MLSSTTKLLSLGQILRSLLTANSRWLQRACFLSKGLGFGWVVVWFETFFCSFTLCILNKGFLHAAWKSPGHVWHPVIWLNSQFPPLFLNHLCQSAPPQPNIDRYRGTPMLLASFVFPRHLFQIHTSCELMLPKLLALPLCFNSERMLSHFPIKERTRTTTPEFECYMAYWLKKSPQT